MIDPFGDDGCHDMGGNVISCPQGVAPGTIIDPSGTTRTVTATPDPTPTCPPGDVLTSRPRVPTPDLSRRVRAPGTRGRCRKQRERVVQLDYRDLCSFSMMMKPRPAGCGAAIAQGAISLGLDVVGAIPAFGNVVSATAAGARAVNGIVAYGGAAYGIATGLPDEISRRSSWRRCRFGPYACRYGPRRRQGDTCSRQFSLGGHRTIRRLPVGQDGCEMLVSS